MELKDITSKFKMTKFRVQMTAQAAVDVQRAMFVMGFRDYTSRSGTPRQPISRRDAIHAFYIDGDCRIHSSCRPPTFGAMTEYREITILEVLEASKQFAQLKRELRAVRQAEKRALREAKETARPGYTYATDVDSVPRNVAIDITFSDNSALESWTYSDSCLPIVPLWFRPVKATVSLADMVADIVADAGGVEVDSDGYIVWDGTGYKSNNDNMGGPVEKGTPVDVKYRSGEVQLGGIAGDIHGPCSPKGNYPSGAFWQNDSSPSDIVAYRLSKPELELVPMEPGVVHYVEPKCTPMDITNFKQADTNPKRQFGVQSVPLNMWSPLASAYGSLGLYNGSLKYGKANFANTPVEASIYIAAAFRHLSAWASGQEFDPADGVPNLGGVLANVAILLEARAAGMLIDDRLKMAGYLKEIDSLKEIVKSLNVLHAGKDPHHYTIGG